MNTTSASPAESPATPERASADPQSPGLGRAGSRLPLADGAQLRRRLPHCGERALAPVHVTLGYTMAGLVASASLWGLVGTRHARFSSFVRGPAPRSRLRCAALLQGQPEHHVGHNPAGALAIVALLGLALVVTAAGWADATTNWAASG